MNKDSSNAMYSINDLEKKRDAVDLLPKTKLPV